MRDLEFTKNEKTEFFYDIIAGFMAVLAVLVVMIELADSFEGRKAYYLYLIDNILYFIFVGDYFIRLIISKDKKDFFIHNIIDLIAILPFGFINSFKYGRALKLIRVLTYLLRLIGNIKEIIFTNNFIYALGITVVITIGGSIGIYFVESNVNGGINTYGDALWWSIVTVSTVGYGDIAIITRLGRVIACILMITGVGFLGMLTSTISTFFFDRYAKNLINECSSSTESEILDISRLSEEDKKSIISYYNYLSFKDRI